MTNRYDDIIELPHPTSSTHPRMPISDRAAIFSPFAALSGHGAAIAETARQTERRIELDESNREKLDIKQRLLEEIAAEQPEVTVTWFRPDMKKEGGSYTTLSGKMKKTDSIERVMVMLDGTKIPLEDIVDIESEWFQGVLENDF